MRNCEIVSRLADDDGNVLFDMSQMHTVLKRSCIKEWAYIIHDRCSYEASEIKEGSSYKDGDLKPEHIHLLLKFDTPQQLKYIAKWFAIGENFISKIRGK
jgi:hypothetical protein